MKMSLNSEVRFSEIPNIEKQRSRFDRSHQHTTTLNTGDLIPLEVKPVLPGDTITCDFSHVTRMMTPIAPVMGNLYLDIMAFFVPTRLLWKHFKEYQGENNTTHWEQPVQYTRPVINAPSGGWSVGSLADYMGIPVGINLEVDHTPFRGYCKIVNDWFRDENLKDPANFNDDETTLTGTNYSVGWDYVTDLQLGGKPFKVAKLHDYFTSCLPAPLKGPDVMIPLGSTAPVITREPDNIPSGYSYPTALTDAKVDIYNNSNVLMMRKDETSGTNLLPNQIVGLAADLSDAVGATISQLRMSFAIQRYYEALARGGSRYVELLKSVWGVTSPDARQQRSEFLGSKRFPINIDQVLQTSSTDAVSPQGNTAAYSVTVNSEDLFTYSSTEHGFLYVLGVIRQEHVYSQGLEKFWTYRKNLDEYVPQLANISEKSVYNSEIYAQGTSIDKETFGYQEAWAEYRYSPNMVTGLMRPNVTGSLAIWNYADNYNSLPMLSGDWINETEANVKRTLAVQNQPQFLMDCYFSEEWTRCMPMYSVPGLLDHF